MQTRSVRREARPGSRRRRTSADGAFRKATFQLHASVLEAIKSAVQSGEAPSASALVEEALKARLREIRRTKLYEAYAEAARDPMFRTGMDVTTRAFDAATADGLTDAEV